MSSILRHWSFIPAGHILVINPAQNMNTEPLSGQPDIYSKQWHGPVQSSHCYCCYWPSYLHFCPRGLLTRNVTTVKRIVTVLISALSCFCFLMALLWYWHRLSCSGETVTDRPRFFCSIHMILVVGRMKPNWIFAATQVYFGLFITLLSGTQLEGKKGCFTFMLFPY